MARPGDAAAIRRLLESRDGALPGSGELELRRLINFDPRQRCVLCATALIDRGERVIGVGSIELGRETPAGPEALVIDPQAPEGLSRLLSGALVGRAAVLARARAA